MAYDTAWPWNGWHSHCWSEVSELRRVWPWGPSVAVGQTILGVGDNTSHDFAVERVTKVTPKEVLALCREKDVKAVDLRFMDFPGLWQHFTIPVTKLDEDVFEDGIGI